MYFDDVIYHCWSGTWEYGCTPVNGPYKFEVSYLDEVVYVVFYFEDEHQELLTLERDSNGLWACDLEKHLWESWYLSISSYDYKGD